MGHSATGFDDLFPTPLLLLQNDTAANQDT